MVDFAEALRQRMVKKGKRTAIDWKPHVANFISDCLDADGVPMFRTRFGGRRFDGLVLGICWGVKGAVPSVWFKAIPHEDLERLEAKTGDWHWLLAKYGTEAQKEKGLTPEALKAFAEKRIPALAAAARKKPKLATMVLEKGRMATVDKLAWTSKVEPEIIKVQAQIDRQPESIIITIGPEAARELSDGVWSILIEWGEQGVLRDAVEGKIEDMINAALEAMARAPRGVDARSATAVQNVMEGLVQGRKPGVFLLEGMVVSANINRGRAEFGVDDGSGTLLLAVKAEHLPDDLAGALQRDDAEALEDALVAERILVPVRPTSLFLRAVTDGPMHLEPTPIRSQVAETEV